MKRFALAFIVVIVVPLFFATAATAAEAQEALEQGVEQGKILFEARCPLCHQLPEPAMLKREQWRRSLTTMQKRMQQAGMSALSDSEFQQVLNYLATQVRD